MKGNQIELTTKHLRLRKETIEDANILFEKLGRDEKITRYTGWNPYATLEQAQKTVLDHIRNQGAMGCYSWIIEFENEPAGTIGAYDYDKETGSIEIGYSIFSMFWGKGIGSAAAFAVTKFLLEEEGILSVKAWCHADNVASIKVLEKAGFKEIQKVPQAIENPDGSFSDKIVFAYERKIE